MMNETNEDKLNAIYPMKKNSYMSIKNILGTPRTNIKNVGKNAVSYKRIGVVN